MMMCQCISGIQSVAEATNVYVWPLGYGAINYEVKTSEQGGTIGDLTLAAGPEDVLNYQALAFKGTETSYVDLRVSSTTPLNDDCAILFYIYLESNTDGVLFHFESDDVGAEDSFTGIEVTFDSTNIMFDFTGNSHSFAGGSDSIPNTIPTGNFTGIWGEGGSNMEDLDRKICDYVVQMCLQHTVIQLMQRIKFIETALLFDCSKEGTKLTSFRFST